MTSSDFQDTTKSPTPLPPVYFTPTAQSTPDLLSSSSSIASLSSTTTLSATTLSTTTLLPSSTTRKVIQPEDNSLPTYEHVKVDMPPDYPKYSKEHPSEVPEYSESVIDDYFDDELYYPSKKKLSKVQPESPWNLVPVEEQEPWPITKKLYIAGFLIWPLWYIGMAFSVFGKDSVTRSWGKRCFVNSLIITGVYIYIVVAYYRTNGKIIN